ncbi:MAG: hypothetical protein AB7U20_18770 [Planctomycetaceae bacterium]
MHEIEQSLLWKVVHASLVQWIGLLVALGVLVGLILRVRALLSEDTDATADHHELLTSISELHREGDLSEDEYRSIKGRLISRLGDGPVANQ